MSAAQIKTATCYHCGDECAGHPIQAHNKDFCCQGCLSVYEILSKSGMCDYYDITKNPGVSRKTSVRKDKFAFLDQKDIVASLISFRDEKETHVTFHLPQIHCSSCLWLLENLHRLNKDVQSCRVNFVKKEATVVFNHRSTSLRGVAELLTGIGYEPYISLQQLSKRSTFFNRGKILKLGVAGFCFGNIMLFSFPEYLGIDIHEGSLVIMFRYLNLLLSLPVFFYSSSEFYLSAWKSLRHGFLNIDAPIVLATLVTFGRSLYEVLSGTGSGYFDSMSGIVFFMLIGRVLQDKTYEQLDFERDYTSFFPIAATRVVNGEEEIVTLPGIRLNDTLLLHHHELVPADGILTRGRAVIDYSFVTGESVPVVKEMGEIVYAGGKQLEGNIEILVIHEVNQGYLTRIWNRSDNTAPKNRNGSFVNLLSRYFTILLFSIAALSACYWYFHDPSAIANVVTSILIVACPCALLLSNTFTNGNILRILGRKGFYLRNAQTIEEIGDVDHIVFDKTGTLTSNREPHIQYDGKPLSALLKKQVTSLAKQSSHPVSRIIAGWLGNNGKMSVLAFKEVPGMGIEGIVEEDLISLGSSFFITGKHEYDATGSCVFLSVEGEHWGTFRISNRYREDVPLLLKNLQKKYSISILSGDNAAELPYLQGLLGMDTHILFNQSPAGKLDYIKDLQSKGHKVMMVGDGLNDAGALKQADAGIAVSDNQNNFTPASDGILKAEALTQLDRFIRMCKANRVIVLSAFIVSILYNIIGLSFAVQAQLSPMIAAVLMPASSLSILLIAYGCSNMVARRLKLAAKTDDNQVFA